jgi:hypothetical protein
MKDIIGFFKKIRTYYHDFIILGASIIGLLLPIILYLVNGCVAESISSYQYESGFLLWLLLTIISLGYMTGTIRYQLSGLLLFGLACVNIEISTMLHNIIAGLFFIHTTRLIIINKKFSLYAIPIFMALFLYMTGKIDLYLFEIISISTVSIFTATYSMLKIKAREFRGIESVQTMKKTMITNKKHE